MGWMSPKDISWGFKGYEAEVRGKNGVRNVSFVGALRIEFRLNGDKEDGLTVFIC